MRNNYLDSQIHVTKVAYLQFNKFPIQGSKLSLSLRASYSFSE